MSHLQQDKKNYHAPEVRDYGTVRELTQNSENSFTAPIDNGSDGFGSATLSNTSPRNEGVPAYVTGGVP